MAIMIPRVHSGLTLTRIESINALGAAWKQLEAAIAKDSTRTTRTLGNLGGATDRPLYVRDDLGIWMSKGLRLAEGYFWLPFGTLPMKPRGNLSMVVQLNRPTVQGKRSVAGILAVDADGSQWICHSGNIGGGRPGIGRSAFLAWTPRPAVTVVAGNGKKDVALPITRVGDQGMDAAMAEFVREVERFKADPRRRPPARSVTFGGSARELEGSSTVVARAGYEMTRTHAAVRNRLDDLLSDCGLKTGRDTLRDVTVGNAKRPDFEFEVKVSPDPQSVYTAVGQLLVHGVSTPSKRRVAVLPHTLSRDHAAALQSLGIDLVTFRIARREIVFTGLDRLVPGIKTSAPLGSSRT